VQGIAQEIARAVRNLAGLKVRREKGAGGKRTSRDDARELAARVGGLREYVVEVLTRMELHRRDRRDIWYDPSIGKPPLVWLKETFEQVNNGRHQDFTLPTRIEVIVPQDLLDATDLTLRIIDTRESTARPRARIWNVISMSRTRLRCCAPASMMRRRLQHTFSWSVPKRRASGGWSLTRPCWFCRGRMKLLRSRTRPAYGRRRSKKDMS